MRKQGHGLLFIYLQAVKVVLDFNGRTWRDGLVARKMLSKDEVQVLTSVLSVKCARGSMIVKLLLT